MEHPSIYPISNSDILGSQAARNAVPQIIIVDSPTSNSFNTTSLNEDSSNFTSSRNSIVSSVNSIYTSVSFSNDKELEKLETPTEKANKYKQLFKKKDDTVFKNPEHQEYHRYTNEALNVNYYNYSISQVLKLNWNEIFEVYFFGERIDSVFGIKDVEYELASSIPLDLSTIKKRNDYLMKYFINSKMETGDLIFQLTRFKIKYITMDDLKSIFDDILINLKKFEGILLLYSNEENLISNDLFEMFQNFMELNKYPFPLSLSMFGNYLLSFNTSNINNYNNELIINFFRKSARISWILKILNDNHYFDEVLSIYQTSDQIVLKQFLNKDNTVSLGLSLNNLGEFYQFHNDHDTAVNIWEISSHLTGDSDSCSMAIWGLTDGFGSGNRIKTINKFGRKSKTNKFNTKRRIAQIYRINNNNDLGTSWVWKEKYD